MTSIANRSKLRLGPFALRNKRHNALSDLPSDFLQQHNSQQTAAIRVTTAYLQLLMRRALLVIVLMVFAVPKDRLRSYRVALAQWRRDVDDFSSYVGDDVRFAVLS